MPSFIEQLELRIAPASAVLFDVDGDKVTIETSLGTNDDLLDAITFDTIVREIDFSRNAVFDGTDLTIIAEKVTPQGDGLVRIGYIDAAASNGADSPDGVNLHLGNVFVDGDLGQIDVGVDDGTRALGSLTVFSIGRFGDTQAPATASNISTFVGKTGPITVAEGVSFSSLQLNTCRGLSVGGDFASSNVHAATKIGFVKIRGDLSGVGAETGQITGGDIARVKVRGNVTGGSDALGAEAHNTGRISVTGDLGTVRIGGNLMAVGSGDHAAEISALGSIERVTISGSLIAAQYAGNGISNSAKIQAGENIGPIAIGGDFRGANTPAGTSGVNNVAAITAGGAIASITIGGSIAAGHDFNSGNFILIKAGKDIGALTVGGGINGTGTVPVLISAGIADQPVLGKLRSIGPITVGQSMKNTFIEAGVGPTPSEDAQIGRVTIGGDFIESRISAGVMSGTDQPGLFSKIGNIIVGGHVKGDSSPASFYGFTAQHVRGVTVAGAVIPLQPGAGNDTTPITIGGSGDVRVTELPA